MVINHLLTGMILQVGGGFLNIFGIFTPENWGNGIQFDERAYFSDGLVEKPPTGGSFTSSEFF